jgi:hypothetical protein
MSFAKQMEASLVQTITEMLVEDDSHVQAYKDWVGRKAYWQQTGGHGSKSGYYKLRSAGKGKAPWSDSVKNKYNSPDKFHRDAHAWHDTMSNPIIGEEEITEATKFVDCDTCGRTHEDLPDDCRSFRTCEKCGDNYHMANLKNHFRKCEGIPASERETAVFAGVDEACEDYPCCGHEPGDCPDSQGRMTCVGGCGKRLSKKATSSICTKCQRKMSRHRPTWQRRNS